MKLDAGEVVHSDPATLDNKEAADVSELSTIDSNIDASLLLPSAAKTMLQELENPHEFNSLTDLFQRLSDVSAGPRNCSAGSVSCDVDHKIIDHDIYTSEISRKVQNQKSGNNHLSDARARITKLKENSRRMVSMFIPQDPPKLSFSEDVIGMCYY